MQFWLDSIWLCLCRKALLSGPICGAAAQWVSSPTDLLKVRMQLECRRRLHGLPPRFLPLFVPLLLLIAADYYRKTARDHIISFDLSFPLRRNTSVWQALRSIVREEGVLGLYRGSVPNVQRAFLVNLGGTYRTSPRVRTLSISLIYGTVQYLYRTTLWSSNHMMRKVQTQHSIPFGLTWPVADLTTYDLVKHWLLTHSPLAVGPFTLRFEDDWRTHTVGSICAAVVAATASSPADVIKTRLMDQPLVNGRCAMSIDRLSRDPLQEVRVMEWIL